jgi:hypothetical protein
MPQIFSKHPWVLRTLYWIAIAAAYTAFHVISSIHDGKLALPPKYDDVGYLSQGAQWLNAWKSGGLAEFWSAGVAHAPISAYTAFFGFLIFGPYEWAPYAVNGVFVCLFLLGLDDLAKGLPTYQRLLLPLTALTYPLLASLVMEFRPDILCSIVTAYLLTLIIKTNWLNPTRSRLLLLGILLGVALLSKPSIFPITIGLTVGGIGISALVDYKKQGYGRSLLRIINKATQVLGLGILVACPYYIDGGLKNTTDYIKIVMTGPNQAVWETRLSLKANLLYYLTGYGSMLGNWLGIGVSIITLAFSVSLARQDHKLVEKNMVTLIVFGLAYASVTIPAVKSPFLGVIVSALILLTNYCAMKYLLSIFNREATPYIQPLLKFVLTSICILGLSIHQWKEYPYLGGGIHRLSIEKLAEARQPLQKLSAYFTELSDQSPQRHISCFLTTIIADTNMDNLRLSLQLQGIQSVDFYDIGINQNVLDRPETYFEKIQAADYVIFPRSPQVSYPTINPKLRALNLNMGEQIAQYLDRSPDFEKLRSFDTPAIDGKVEIYGKVSLKSQSARTL